MVIQITPYLNIQSQKYNTIKCNVSDDFQKFVMNNLINLKYEIG